MDPKHRIIKGLYFSSESHHDCIVNCIFVYYYINENVNKYVYHMTSRLGVK